MIWTVFLLGLVVAAFGATAGGALVATSRAELARYVAARLRGVPAETGRLGEVETLLVAASSTTALGVLVLGASLPALVVGEGVLPSLGGLVFVGVPVVLAAGYFLPRWLTERRAEAVARAVLPALRPWARFVGLLLPAAGPQQRFRAIQREGGSLDADAEGELSLMGGVLTFAQRPVREVMTPRTDIVAISEYAPVEEITAVFAQSGYSRIPVFRGTLDEIVGMLHAFDLFRLRPGAPLPVRPVTAAPASRGCADLLVDMQRERRHMAVVLDEYGGTLGVVTLDDLLEAMVGEIAEDEPVAPGAGAPLLEADGGLARDAVEERFDVRLPPARAATIGGLVAELAGRIPNAGERFVAAGLEFDVLQASPTRIERVVIRPVPPAPVPLPEGAA